MVILYLCRKLRRSRRERSDMDRAEKSTIEVAEGRWTCSACGYEWSAMMGDNEVPEVCECQLSTSSNTTGIY